MGDEIPKIKEVIHDKHPQYRYLIALGFMAALVLGAIIITMLFL